MQEHAMIVRPMANIQSHERERAAMAVSIRADVQHNAGHVG
jgi:hypothetical protein